MKEETEAWLTKNWWWTSMPPVLIVRQLKYSVICEKWLDEFYKGRCITERVLFQEKDQEFMRQPDDLSEWRLAGSGKCWDSKISSGQPLAAISSPQNSWLLHRCVKKKKHIQYVSRIFVLQKRGWREEPPSSLVDSCWYALPEMIKASVNAYQHELKSDVVRLFSSFPLLRCKDDWRSP